MSINTSVAGSGTASNASATILLGRILLAVIFLLSGFGKLTAIAGTAGYFGSLGLPLPTVTAVVVGLIELLGGLAILVGFQTRIAAWVLADLHRRHRSGRPYRLGRSDADDQFPEEPGDCRRLHCAGLLGRRRLFGRRQARLSRPPKY